MGKKREASSHVALFKVANEVGIVRKLQRSSSDQLLTRWNHESLRNQSKVEGPLE